MARVRISHLLLFTKEFASMVESRLRLVQVLENLAAETPQRRLRDAIEDVSDRVRYGIELADALEEHPRIFNEVYVNTVRAGMASGRLSKSLFQVAEYLSNVEAINKKMSRAAAYPAFIGLSFVVVFNVMTFFILPRFQQMFSNFGKELPLPTIMMINFGDFYAAFWPYLIGGIAICGVAFFFWTNTTEGRIVWDELKLKLPLIGTLWRLSALSRFLRTTAVQVHNYVPILGALEVAAASSGNRHVENVLGAIVEDIRQGRRISSAFSDHDVFQGIVQQMIVSGEEAGTMDQMLLSAANYFDGMLADKIDVLANLINPLLTAFVGMATAAMLVAAFLPVFDISGAAL